MTIDQGHKLAHPPIREDIDTLSPREIYVLYKHLEREFITYENDELVDVMKKITAIAIRYELDSKGS